MTPGQPVHGAALWELLPTATCLWCLSPGRPSGLCLGWSLIWWAPHLWAEAPPGGSLPQADQMPSAPCPQVTSRPLLPVLRPPHCRSCCLFPSLYHHPRLHAPPGQAAPSPYKAPRTQHLLTAAHRPGREGWTSGWVAGEGYRTRGSRLQELLPSCAHHQLPVAQPTGTESPF